MPNYLEVGKIVNTHGIKGEVRVQSVTDFPEVRYAKGSKLIIERHKNDYIPVVVASHRVHKSFDLLTFEGYPTINDVEAFKQSRLLVDESLVPDLDENEYFVNQIIGAKVVDKNKNTIGTLKEVLFLPANDVWVVERQVKKDLLLPFIESVILDVNIEDQIIVAHVLEGLDDDED